MWLAYFDVCDNPSRSDRRDNRRRTKSHESIRDRTTLRVHMLCVLLCVMAFNIVTILRISPRVVRIAICMCTLFGLATPSPPWVSVCIQIRASSTRCVCIYLDRHRHRIYYRRYYDYTDEREKERWRVRIRLAELIAID